MSEIIAEKERLVVEMESSTNDLKAIVIGKLVSVLGVVAGGAVGVIGASNSASSVTEEAIHNGQMVYEAGRNVSIAAAMILFGLIAAERIVRKRYYQDKSLADGLR